MVRKILFPLLLTALVACTEHGEFERRLAVADSLIAVEPDSAYRMLDAMSDETGQMPQAKRMRHLLLRTQAQRHAGIGFTSDSISNLLVSYYNAHGTPNERMTAHYLKGCSYLELGDEPATLRCFNEAVGTADTSALDCNYAQMGDIYGQIARIYNNHAMPDSALRAYGLAEHYARKANDTINVITIWGNKSNVLIDLGRISEALELREMAAERFKAMGYSKKAARVKGLCIKWYIQQGELDKAKAAMDEYEAISGYSRIKDETKSGWESYFHIKGTYYLETGKLDSANYYFKKLKLASDTLFNIQTAQKLQNAQSMYNYMRHQEAAHRKELESKNVQLRLYRGIAFILLFAAVMSVFVLLLRRRIRRNERQLVVVRRENSRLNVLIGNNNRKLDELNGLIEEKISIITALNDQLNQQAIDLNSYHKQAETIQQLNERIAHYETEMMNQVTANLMNRLAEEPALIVVFQKLKARKEYLSKSEWTELYSTAEKYFPALCNIKTNPKVSVSEYQICVLTKLGLRINDIIYLTRISASNISNMRSRMLSKLFGEEGGAKDFDIKIKSL
ncbi:MAG: hypothetical protein IKY42_01135 [Bacteroidaceae bacterium]|nr:hypothetical protein [Bacteroidaceae bacterium]